MSKKICSSLNKIFVTWFGCGYFPKAPGTAGSFGALPLCWALLQVTFFREFGIYFRISFALLLTLGACFAAAHDQKQNPLNRDPQYIVVDEVVGMIWSIVFLPDHFFNHVSVFFLIAFVFFRIFDVLKPFPANLFDRRSKTAVSFLERGVHIVMDDVIAGLYTAFVLHGFVLYWGVQ